MSFHFRKGDYMNWRQIGLFSVLLLIAAGMLYATAGADVGTPTFLTRWSYTPTTSVTTEGGNISYQNLTGTTLTDKWAGLYGNVTGTIVLTDASAGTANPLYSWSVDNSNNGIVCAGTSTSYVFSSLSTSTAADVDAAWGFGAASDNATNTFTTAQCTLNFTEANVANTINTTHKGTSTFFTCVVDDGGTAKSDFLFCTNISATGTTYNNQPANYELIVPTPQAIGSAGYEIYYFYVDFRQ